MSEIIRRDPRAEWIARNRLHPLHAAMQPAQHSCMGPNGLIRKNPHGIGFIGPNGLKRIDRSGAQQGGSAKRTAAAEVQLPLHQVAQPAFYISVVPDMVGGRLSSHDRDLLGLAHQLAGQDGAVLAVVFGEHKESAFATAVSTACWCCTAASSTVMHRNNGCRACGLWITSSARAIGCCLTVAAAVANWAGAWPRPWANAQRPGSGRSRTGSASAVPAPVYRTWRDQRHV